MVTCCIDRYKYEAFITHILCHELIAGIYHYPISVEPVVVALCWNAMCERPFQFISVTTHLDSNQSYKTDHRIIEIGNCLP